MALSANQPPSSVGEALELSSRQEVLRRAGSASHTHKSGASAQIFQGLDLLLNSATERNSSIRHQHSKLQILQ